MVNTFKYIEYGQPVIQPEIKVNNLSNLSNLSNNISNVNLIKQKELLLL